MGERLAQRLFAVAGKPSWPGASQIERRPARARPAANRRSGNGDVFGGRADEDVPALRAWCVRAFFCYAAPWAWAPAPRAWCAPPRVPPSAVETVPAPRVACPTKGSTQRRGNHPCAARVVRPTKGSARRRGSRPCAARGAPVNRRRCGDVFGGGADEAVPAPRVGAPVNRRSGNGDVFGGRADEDVPALRAWCVRAFFCYAAPWAWAPALRAWCAPPRVPPSAVETVPAPRVARPSTGEDAATFSAAGPMKPSLCRAWARPSTGEVATAALLAEGPMKMSLRCARGAPHQGFRPAPWKPSLRRAWCAPPRVLPSAVETIPALRAWCAPTKGSAQRRGNRSCAARGRVRQPAKMRRRFRRRGR